MFAAALFIKTKKWKQPKCSSTNEWKYKMCNISILSGNKKG